MKSPKLAIIIISLLRMAQMRFLFLLPLYCAVRRPMTSPRGSHAMVLLLTSLVALQDDCTLPKHNDELPRFQTQHKTDREREEQPTAQIMEEAQQPGPHNPKREV